MKTINYKRKRGDTFKLSFTVKTAAGVAIDITGYTFWLTLKTDLSKTDAQATKQVERTTHDDAANGKTSLTIDPADTKNYLGCYFYDVQIKTPAGIVETFQDGVVVFDDDVTLDFNE